MKKIKTYMLMGLMATTMLSSCTDVELCEQQHPHTGTLVFNFGTKDINRCYVIADRIVNHTSYSMDIDLDGTGSTGKGYYIYNAPTDSISRVKNAEKSFTEYTVLPGDYTIMAYNFTTPGNEALTTARKGTAQDSVFISLNTYKATDQSFRNGLPTGISMDKWTDYNNYAPYIQTLQTPIYTDEVEMINVEKGQKTTCPLSPTRQSLKVNVRFSIAKDLSAEQFTVDKVVLEMAGIPRNMELHSKKIDISKTYKSMILSTLNSGSADAMTSKTVSCIATADVISLIPPVSKDVSMGSGIMQVIIYVTTASGKSKIMQGKINLYSSIKNAGHIQTIQDDPMHISNAKSEITLSISPLSLSSDKIISSGNGSEVDGWQRMNEVIFVTDDFGDK